MPLLVQPIIIFRDDVAAGRPPLGFVEMSDVLDVRVAHDQRNTLALIRSGEVTQSVWLAWGHSFYCRKGCC
jgi:hypothetical protein